MTEAFDETVLTESDHAAARAIARARLRAEVLTPGPERDRHVDQHPLNNRPLYILTMPVLKTFQEVVVAIKRKRPGQAYMAEFRKGKSTGWKMIKTKIKEVLPNVAFGLVPASTLSSNTDAALWREILEAHGLPVTGTAQERRSRFMNYVISSCITAGGRHFVLFIDEGQNWGEAEYTYLRDLETALADLHDYLLTTVIVGDPKLQDLSDAFRATRKDLWSRFMMAPAQFPGTDSVDDLKFYMAEHDSIKRCEYPAGSGVSYTEFFMQKAYAAGWRLEDQAQMAWEAYARAAETVGRKPENIGMQWVSEAVVEFLLAVSARDSANFASEAADWDKAIHDCCYVESLI